MTTQRALRVSFQWHRQKFPLQPSKILEAVPLPVPLPLVFVPLPLRL